MSQLHDNVICIPYRDREEQLNQFVKTSAPLLLESLPNTKILVLEQEAKKPFNRGLLLNVGFKLYKDKTRYFFTHDVDLYPTTKFITELYTKHVDDEHVLGLYTSRYNTLGGIIKLTNKTIHKINGFPNDMWGWGVEDKALQNRAEFYNIEKITNLMNNKEHPEYLKREQNPTSPQKIDFLTKTDFHYNQFKNLPKEQKEKYITSTGIANLSFEITSENIISDNILKTTIRV